MSKSVCYKTKSFVNSAVELGFGRQTQELMRAFVAHNWRSGKIAMREPHYGLQIRRLEWPEGLFIYYCPILREGEPPKLALLGIGPKGFLGGHKDRKNLKELLHHIGIALAIEVAKHLIGMQAATLPIGFDGDTLDLDSSKRVVGDCVVLVSDGFANSGVDDAVQTLGAALVDVLRRDAARAQAFAADQAGVSDASTACEHDAGDESSQYICASATAAQAGVATCLTAVLEAGAGTAPSTPSDNVCGSQGLVAFSIDEELERELGGAQAAQVDSRRRESDETRVVGMGQLAVEVKRRRLERIIRIAAAVASLMPAVSQAARSDDAQHAGEGASSDPLGMLSVVHAIGSWMLAAIDQSRTIDVLSMPVSCSGKSAFLAGRWVRDEEKRHTVSIDTGAFGTIVIAAPASAAEDLVYAHVEKTALATSTSLVAAPVSLDHVVSANSDQLARVHRVQAILRAVGEKAEFVLTVESTDQVTAPARAARTSGMGLIGQAVRRPVLGLHPASPMEGVRQATVSLRRTPFTAGSLSLFVVLTYVGNNVDEATSALMGFRRSHAIRTAASVRIDSSTPAAVALTQPVRSLGRNRRSNMRRLPVTASQAAQRASLGLSIREQTPAQQRTTYRKVWSNAAPDTAGLSMHRGLQ